MPLSKRRVPIVEDKIFDIETTADWLTAEKETVRLVEIKQVVNWTDANR